MAKLLRQNVGGVDYTMAGCALTGVCASAASDFIKVVTLSDGDQLSDGMSVVVTFANGNTAGTSPLSKTIYSSDQVNYYEDDQLTVPFTLASEGCYDIEYTGEGNAYSYVSYPIMQVGSISGPLCDASGNKASGALWLAGDKVSVNYSNGCFNVIPQATDSMTVMTASNVVNGAPIRVGSTVRIMFTADIAGANTTSVLTLTYNGVSIPVKVGKNGALSNFVASEVSSGVYKYVQAYTTLELMYDGTQFIIIGNPVVLSSTDYTIYADGLKRENAVTSGSKNMVTSDAVYTALFNKNNLSIEDNRGYNLNPNEYIQTYGQGFRIEFKYCNVINSPFSGTYCILITIVPWSDFSGGVPVQIAIDTYNNTGLAIKKRTSADMNNWGAWFDL